MVIPDADTHMDGQPVLTYSYTLYRLIPGQDKLTADLDALLAPEKTRHPDHLGTLYFDQPDKAFTYTSDGVNELSNDQVESLIGKITRFRKSPTL